MDDPHSPGFDNPVFSGLSPLSMSRMTMPVGGESVAVRSTHGLSSFVPAAGRDSASEEVAAALGGGADADYDELLPGSIHLTPSPQSEFTDHEAGPHPFPAAGWASSPARTDGTPPDDVVSPSAAHAPPDDVVSPSAVHARSVDVDVKPAAVGSPGLCADDHSSAFTPSARTKPLQQPAAATTPASNDASSSLSLEPVSEAPSPTAVVAAAAATPAAAAAAAAEAELQEGRESSPSLEPVSALSPEGAGSDFVSGSIDFASASPHGALSPGSAGGAVRPLLPCDQQTDQRVDGPLAAGLPDDDPVQGILQEVEEELAAQVPCVSEAGTPGSSPRRGPVAEVTTERQHASPGRYEREAMERRQRQLQWAPPPAKAQPASPPRERYVNPALRCVPARVGQWEAKHDAERRQREAAKREAAKREAAAKAIPAAPPRPAFNASPVRRTRASADRRAPSFPEPPPVPSVRAAALRRVKPRVDARNPRAGARTPPSRRTGISPRPVPRRAPSPPQQPPPPASPSPSPNVPSWARHLPPPEAGVAVVPFLPNNLRAVSPQRRSRSRGGTRRRNSVVPQSVAGPTTVHQLKSENMRLLLEIEGLRREKLEMREGIEEMCKRLNAQRSEDRAQRMRQQQQHQQHQQQQPFAGAEAGSSARGDGLAEARQPKDPQPSNPLPRRQPSGADGPPRLRVRGGDCMWRAAAFA